MGMANATCRATSARAPKQDRGIEVSSQRSHAACQMVKDMLDNIKKPKKGRGKKEVNSSQRARITRGR